MIIMVAGELTSIPLTTNPQHVWPKGALFGETRAMSFRRLSRGVKGKMTWRGGRQDSLLKYLCFVIVASEE